MSKWPGKLTREQAVKLIDKIIDQDDPYWEYMVEDFYDEETDTMPNMFHIYAALGITEDEYREIVGDDVNFTWPD